MVSQLPKGENQDYADGCCSKNVFITLSGYVFLPLRVREEEEFHFLVNPRRDFVPQIRGSSENLSAAAAADALTRSISFFFQGPILQNIFALNAWRRYHFIQLIRGITLKPQTLIRKSSFNYLHLLKVSKICAVFLYHVFKRTEIVLRSSSLFV